MGASFACISPFTCAVCYLYFVADEAAARGVTMPFDTLARSGSTAAPRCLSRWSSSVVLWFNFTGLAVIGLHALQCVAAGTLRGTSTAPGSRRDAFSARRV